MKILFFNWMDIKNPSAGGAEVLTHEIAKRLVQKNHDVTLFASSFEDCKGEEDIDGVKIYRAGNKYTIYWKAREYYNKYFKGKYDIVIDEINTVPFFTPKFVTNGEKIFVLIHQLAREFWFHEVRFPVNLLGYYYFEDRWLNLYKEIPTFTVSNSTKNDLEFLGFRDIFVLPEGIDFTPLEELPEKEKDPTLIFLGRLKSSKNPQDALEAYKIVKKELPNAKMWVVGEGYLKERLKKDAVDGVTFWGYVPSDKKKELLKRAHVVLVPGIREGWGLVVTEANGMGTPAVAYDVPGLRDSVRHNVTGLLCNTNTPQDLASEILRLLKDRQLYKRLCTNSLDWSRSFSWDNTASMFLEIIDKGLKEEEKSKSKQGVLTKKRVVVLAESTMPPLSRANLRIVKLAEALTRGGYAVTMLTPSHTPFSRRSYYQSGFHLNQFWGCCKYAYSGLRIPVRLWHLTGTILSIIYLRLRYFKISAIHAWNPLAGIAATIAGKIIKTPVYIDFTDFYSDIARTDLPLLVSSLTLLEKWVLSSATKVFVVSNRMKEELIKWEIDPDKIFIVPDGTDGDLFNPAVSGAAVREKYKLGSSPLIVYHGDIKEPDGVDLLYHAFVKIRERVPGVKLMILGGGEKYFQSVVALGKELGIHDDIVYTGWIPHEEVPVHLAAADVGSMPMRASLNNNCYLSFKLFEYWGVGKPVVVSRLKAISEIVVDGHNGLLCEPGNIDDMTKAYSELLVNPGKARELGQNGRRLIDSVFRWDKLMSMEVQAYEMKSASEQKNVAAECTLPQV